MRELLVIKETCRVIFIIEFNHKDTSKDKSSSNFHSLICFIHYKIKEIKTEQDQTASMNFSNHTGRVKAWHFDELFLFVTIPYLVLYKSVVSFAYRSSFFSKLVPH
jgi:hypothetical protein